MAKNQDYLEEGKSQTTAPASPSKWPVRSTLLTAPLVYNSDSSSFNTVDTATVYKKTLRLCNPVSCLIISLNSWIQSPRYTKSDKSSWSESPRKPDITLSFVIVLVDIINQQSVLKKRRTWLPSYRKAVPLNFSQEKRRSSPGQRRGWKLSDSARCPFSTKVLRAATVLKKRKFWPKLQTACSVHIKHNDVRLSPELIRLGLYVNVCPLVHDFQVVRPSGCK